MIQINLTRVLNGRGVFDIFFKDTDLGEKKNRTVQDQKRSLRREILEQRVSDPFWLSSNSKSGWGKAAERLRGFALYRKARTVYVSPDKSLHQVRLNVLADHKGLILPTPGLQKGFVLLDPAEIPVPKRFLAVQPHQSVSFGKRLAYDAVLKDPIEMMVMEALVVGRDGSRLGDGSGHSDLQYALLDILGWIHPQVWLVAIVQSNQIVASVPMDETDVGVHQIVTPQEILKTSYIKPARGKLVWEEFSAKQIRRNDVLFYLHRKYRQGFEQ